MIRAPSGLTTSRSTRRRVVLLGVLGERAPCAAALPRPPRFFSNTDIGISSRDSRDSDTHTQSRSVSEPSCAGLPSGRGDFRGCSSSGMVRLPDGVAALALRGGGGDAGLARGAGLAPLSSIATESTTATLAAATLATALTPATLAAATRAAPLPVTAGAGLLLGGHSSATGGVSLGEFLFITNYVLLEGRQ
jgi:hypothetical protein